MDSKDFKDLFDQVAKANGFSKAFGGWFKESSDCVAILELQKSSFGDNYYLNLKIFIQGVFGRTYFPNKDLIKSSMGHITNQIRDEDFLNLDASLENSVRKEKLEKLFNAVVVPFTTKTLKKEGIRELHEQGELTLLPAIKKQLEI